MEASPSSRSIQHASIFILFLFITGCNVNPSRRDVVGTYALKGRTSDQIILWLSPDGEFKEQILVSGNVSSVDGRWSVRDGNIDFDRLWIPQAFAPQYILDADKQAVASGQPKYTERGHWNVPVEKWWGRMKIEIFPDDDVQFVMVSRT
jgi:hypothetical protein